MESPARSSDLDARGRALLDDGAIVRLPQALAAHVGDVIVLGEHLPLGLAFRDSPTVDGLTVLPIGRLGWARALVDCTATATATARAAVWLSSALLVAGPFLGMFNP